MAGIFISYRRDDSAGQAGRIYDRLSAHFGAAKVFMDVEGIKPGQEFPDVIERKVVSSNVLLAIIGKRWLTAADENGHSRLEDPADFVRREIAAALNRRIRVLPVLVSGARMPHSEELPGDLAKVAELQALPVSDAQFQRDVAQLIDAVQESVTRAGVKRKRAKKVGLRAEAATLSPDEVKAMLAMHGFYCKRWNEAGKGIEHEYKTIVQQGAVVVTDKATSLMWQKSGSPATMTFEETGDYIQEMNARKFAGFDNWRVPTLEEAMSLMKPDKAGQYYLDPVFDGASIMWTADRHTKEDGAWMVYFFDGICTGESIRFNGYVRAVR